MKFNWGHKIIILYIGFVGLIGTMVYLANHENIDLVSSDYYDQEIQFQKKMDSEANARPFENAIKVTLEGKSVKVQFPQVLADKMPQGRLKMYRSSDASLDYATELHLEAGSQSLISPKFKKGEYTLQMSWTAEGRSYYCEQKVLMN